MRIEILTPDLYEAYERLLLTQPGSLLYQSVRYMDMLVELLGCRQRTLLAIRYCGEVAAALPLMSSEGPYGTVFNSLPFYGSNGGLIGNDPDACAILTNEYNAMVEDRNVAAATVIENPLLEAGARGFRHELIDERIGQFTPIEYPSEHARALMASFHYKTRNMIRKAEKLGIKVAAENDQLDFLFSVHEQNMAEIGGLPKPRRFFTMLDRFFRPGTDYRLYVARLEGEAVAAVLVFLFNRTAEYFTPVVRKEYRETQALSAAIFQAMCEASRGGMTWWNWGGTWLSQDGVYRFKSRWGTRDLGYRYYTSVRNPALLEAGRGDLLKGYPHFFTVPFSALKSSGVQHHAQ